jgi:hypothetical protein
MGPAATQLLHGPYLAPACVVGSELYCSLSQRLVIVAGFTIDVPIPWPYSAVKGGQRLVLCGDLLRAVWAERSPTIARHWGVSEFTVRDWRYAVPSPLDGRNVSPRSKPEVRCKLVGRYSSFAAVPGDTIHCERCGSVVVAGMSDAPIPWPYHRTQKWQKPSLVLTGDLAEAIRDGETTGAISHHWKISESTVTAFRKALGIANATKGPRRAHSN